MKLPDKKERKEEVDDGIIHVRQIRPNISEKITKMVGYFHRISNFLIIDKKKKIAHYSYFSFY